MKKLSLIAGLACLATVGGVFGAWVFTGTAGAETADAQSISISVVEQVETAGEITASVTSGSLSVRYEQIEKDASGRAVAVDTPANFVVEFEDSTRYGGATPDYTCTANIAITGDLTTYVTTEAISADETGSNGEYSVTFTHEAVLAQLQPDVTITAANVDAFIAAVKASTVAITFTITPTKWINNTNAIGIRSKRGKGGSVKAHPDIASDFKLWLDPNFRYHLIWYVRKHSRN